MILLLGGVCFLIGVTTELSLFIGIASCSRSWWVAYHLLRNLESSFSFFILWLYFLSRVLVFAFNIFCSNIFLFYFFKLMFWNWNIKQVMYDLSFPSTPVSSPYIPIIPIKSIGSKNDLVLWLNFWNFSWETIIF